MLCCTYFDDAVSAVQDLLRGVQKLLGGKVRRQIKPRPAESENRLKKLQ